MGVDWRVNERIETSIEVHLGLVEDTIGPYEAAYYVLDAPDTRLYLQSDNTLDVAVETYPLTYDAVRKWHRVFSVPAILNEKIVMEEIRYTGSTLPMNVVSIDDHRVSRGLNGASVRAV